MLHIDIATRLSAMDAERERRRVIARLVSALESAFNIPQGDQLVLVLGNGHENNNREALRTWVNRQLQRQQLESAASLLPHLTDELNRCLLRWQDRW
jgi:hypothetical protein